MLSQRTNQIQKQKTSHRQIQFNKLLEITTLNIEQRITDEINDNPLLEKEILNDEFEISNQEHEEGLTDFREDFDTNYHTDSGDIYSTQSNHYSKKNVNYEAFLSTQDSFQVELTQNIMLLYDNDTKLIIAKHIIGSLDSYGYLRQKLQDIADDLSFNLDIDVSVGILELILLEIQRIDFSGIGARNLQECLLIQIEHQKQCSNSIVIKNADRIIRENFEALSKKQFEKIKLKQNLSRIELENALVIIAKLNPNPITNNGIISSPHIIPDFIITVINGETNIALNSKNTPSLKVNDFYLEELRFIEKEKKSQKDKEYANYIKEKLDNAKWFIDAINQRQKTLLRTMLTIIELQTEYFLTGNSSNLKPMIQEDIANKIEMDNSTISRIVNNKYAQTDFGIFPLKFFFSKSISTNDGSSVSVYKIKNIIQDLVNEENKENPYTDIQLTKILKNKGYRIGRKAVGKLRNELNIPIGELRKN